MGKLIVVNALFKLRKHELPKSPVQVEYTGQVGSKQGMLIQQVGEVGISLLDFPLH